VNYHWNWRIFWEPAPSGTGALIATLAFGLITPPYRLVLLVGFPQVCHGCDGNISARTTRQLTLGVAEENGYELNERGALLSDRALLFSVRLVAYFCLPLKTERHLID